jgi:hypothetical protein
MMPSSLGTLMPSMLGATTMVTARPPSMEAILTGRLLTLTMVCGAHLGGSATITGRGWRHQQRRGGTAGDGNVLDPTLLSAADKEDANNDNEYTIGDNSVDKPLAFKSAKEAMVLPCRLDKRLF